VDDRSRAASINGAARSEEAKSSTWVNVFFLAIWLLAGAMPFIPYDYGSSILDNVLMRLPENEGNVWHMFMGVPFFLAYPMIWLRLRALFSTQPPTPIERRLIWSAVACSVACTILVHVPFLLHFAGASEWQRLAVPSLVFGIVALGALAALLLPRQISPTWACLVGLDTAYLGNLVLCLIMYSHAEGGRWSKAGWLVSTVIVWPILLELMWLLIQTFRANDRKSIPELQDELVSS
jgi:hypothetical protein